MPLMTRLRESLTKVFGIFALLFIIYIILDWGLDVTNRKGRRDNRDIIGNVNGQIIRYNQFNELLRQATEDYKRQTKGKEADDDISAQLRQRSWDQMVTQMLVDQQIKQIGLKITDQELNEWVRGDNPPEMLTRFFSDSTGKFNRAAYEQAMNDPRLKSEWVKIEPELRKQRLQEKLRTLMCASVVVSDGEISQRFKDMSTLLTTKYALFDPARYISDTAVHVTDDDVKTYYNENQDEFKRQHTRKLKYVQFLETPSASDSAAVLDELVNLKKQIEGGADFLEQATTYSETPVSDSIFIKPGQGSAERDSKIFGTAVGSIVGPFIDNDGYHLIKILDTRKGKEPYLHASHILWKINPGDDTTKIYTEARSVLARIKKGEDFADLARLYSKDGSASNGGDLGWNGKGRWVKPFEDAAFKLKVGEVSGLVRSQFGIHIIKVTGRDDREVRIADIHMSIKPSSQTRDNVLQNAKDFAYLAKEGDFDNEAKISKLEVQETQQFAKGPVVPGIGMNDILVKFTFDKKLGSVCEPVRINGGYGVFKISEIKEAGIRPFDEVTEMIRSKVLQKKRIEKVGAVAQQAYTKLAPNDSLGVLKQFDPLLNVLAVGPFSSAQGIPGIGRDFNFIATALRLQPGEISKPFEGTRGYYIVQLVSKTPFDSAGFLSRKTGLRNQILQEKRQRLINDWLTKLKDDASIEDDRDKFFR